jgi:hypothetical protein
MPLPNAVEDLWMDLEAARAAVLREAEGLSQRQADFKPAEKEWSIGEVLDHLTLAETLTGQFTHNLLDAAPPTGFPADLQAFASLPDAGPGPANAPEIIWPKAGKAVAELIATMQVTRERSRQSVERLATVDPRRFTRKHPWFGDLDLGQWWTLQAYHDRMHLRQIREVKAAAGFPRA